MTVYPELKPVLAIFLPCLAYVTLHVTTKANIRSIFGKIILLLISFLFYILVLDGSIKIIVFYVFCLMMSHLDRKKNYSFLLSILCLLPLIYHRLLPGIFGHSHLIYITGHSWANTFAASSFISLALITMIMNKTSADSFADKLLYIFFFPKVMGPIDDWQNFARQEYVAINLNEKALFKPSFLMLKSLVQLLLCTLAQYNLIAVISAQNSAIPISIIIVIGACQFIILYYSIQAFTVIPQCLASFFSIKITDNFRKPFKAVYISEFWQRWHINITRFFGRYVYRKQINLGFSENWSILLTFLTLSIWHGNYAEMILGGFIFGGSIILERKLSLKPSNIRTLLICSTVFVLFVPGGVLAKINFQSLLAPIPNIYTVRILLLTIIYLLTCKSLDLLVDKLTSGSIRNKLFRLPIVVKLIMISLSVNIAIYLLSFTIMYDIGYNHL